MGGANFLLYPLYHDIMNMQKITLAISIIALAISIYNLVGVMR